MKSATPVKFNEHLDRIKRAKNAASLLEQMNVAEQSMGMLWERLFDQLCVDAKSANFSTTKEIVGVLTKLLRNYRELFAVCSKINNAQVESDLSEEMLSNLEDKLNLL